MASDTDRKYTTNLSDLRGRTGYAQAEVARRAKITTSYYARCEQGRQLPRPAIQRQIAKALGVGIAALSFEPLEATEA